MNDARPLAWLFDIDGTLLLTEGAAREAFAAAARETLDLAVEDDLKDVSFAGRIEPMILADILAKHGRSFSEAEEAHFWNIVFQNMRRLLHPGRGHLLPGVLPLLDALAAEPRWVIGLLTGNMTEMARIKLDRFGIWERFAFGGFGEQAVSRNELARALVAQVGREYGIPPAACIVVGDTEHDIECARFAGARVVAVATGSYRRDQLAAGEPDLLLDDLRDARGLMRWARGLAEPSTKPA